jgi:NAD+ synthase/NAD+ synthase (glutamine-hydrolysing)
VKIALAQANAVIGDVDGNVARLLDFLPRARRSGADLAVFPEQAIIGYPARDLLFRRELIERNLAGLERLAAAAQDIGVIVGYAEPNPESRGRPLFNAAALVQRGEVLARWRKRLLPEYDVFDEARYFEPAGPHSVFDYRGLRIGVTVCEDMWSHEKFFGRTLYTCDPIGDLATAGAELVFNLSASPFWLGKHAFRLELIAQHSRRNSVPVVFVNQVGGNDQLLFDGASCMVDASGHPVAQAKSFEEDLLIFDTRDPSSARCEPVPDGPESLYAALVMGLRDYLRKCGFRTAVLGLSGGIDSAVVAALAVEALGAASVHAVAMPGRFSSDHSIRDAEALAANLGIRLSTIPIEPMHASFESALANTFAGRAPDVTEENIQARVRGTILMALSNKFGSLLLTTGNKSELGVGYCTLYGDMCGGLAVISDVPKTLVYALGRHINRRAGRALIPESSLTKPPSAELRANQTDQDSLPPYEELDPILERFDERLMTKDEIIADGFDPQTVERVVRLIQSSEYKRQQAAPGLKVTSRAFGIGRRVPIAARPPA